MKRIAIMAAAFAAFYLTGCQTRITATKNAEVANPIQQVVTVGGVEQVVTTGYMVTSGGWEATARSPLYAAEALEGLQIGVATNGTVSLAIDKYHRDTSTNAVAMVEGMFSGGAQLAIAIGEAYTKIAGGGAQAATLTDVTAKVISYFKSSGGDETKATVTTTDAGKIKVSDGSTCVECDANGNCAACSE